MFNIQISNPTAIEIRDVDDENIKEAIETVFPLKNEYCFIIWNYVFIPVSYKYDISCMIHDIFRIVNFIQKGDGSLEINWGSDTFYASWKIVSSSQSIKIESKWFSVLGKLEELLNENATLEVETQSFLDKWKTLLLFIKSKLERAGYNSKNLVDFYLLENIN